MPIEVNKVGQIKPGDIYEDSAFHPCICIGVENAEIWGISLVDGSYPRSEEIGLSGVRKLTTEEAWEWRTAGPQDVKADIKKKWW